MLASKIWIPVVSIPDEDWNMYYLTLKGSTQPKECWNPVWWACSRLILCSACPKAWSAKALISLYHERFWAVTTRAATAMWYDIVSCRAISGGMKAIGVKGLGSEANIDGGMPDILGWGLLHVLHWTAMTLIADWLSVTAQGRTIFSWLGSRLAALGRWLN